MMGHKVLLVRLKLLLKLNLVLLLLWWLQLLQCMPLGCRALGVSVSESMLLKEHRTQLNAGFAAS